MKKKPKTPLEALKLFMLEEYWEDDVTLDDKKEVVLHMSKNVLYPSTMVEWSNFYGRQYKLLDHLTTEEIEELLLEL